MSGQFCIECGKEFKSSKALHGHLRCHPERNYRGTNPTSRRNFIRQKRKYMGSGRGASQWSSPPAVQEPLLVQPLSWCPPDHIPPPVKKMLSKTPNRRLPSDASSTYNLSTLAAAASSLSVMENDFQINPPPQSYTSQDMPPLPTAACIGRHLANLDPNSFSQQSDELDTNSSPTSAMQESFLLIDSHLSDQIVVCTTHNLSLEANLNDGTDFSSDRSNTTSLISVKKSLQGGSKKKRKAEDGLIQEGSKKKRKVEDGLIHAAKEGPIKKRKVEYGLIHAVWHQIHNKRGFNCNICSKSFDSYQALGGHMTSHIDKNKAIGSGSDKTTGHPCNICGEIYPTGQALGGHKRKHWKAPQIETHPQHAPQPQSENKLPGFKLFGVWISV